MPFPTEGAARVFSERGSFPEFKLPRPRLTVAVSYCSGTNLVRTGMPDETAGAGRPAWPLEAGGP